MRHHAGWHGTRHLKFNQTKLERLQKKLKKNLAHQLCTHISSHGSIDFKDNKCFLCNKPARSEDLHSASTYDIDMKVHRCAIELEDTALLAKLEPGDMIALEAKYHQKCLANLYSRTRALESTVCNKSCGTFVWYCIHRIGCFHGRPLKIRHYTYLQIDWSFIYVQDLTWAAWCWCWRPDTQFKAQRKIIVSTSTCSSTFTMQVYNSDVWWRCS